MDVDTGNHQSTESGTMYGDEGEKRYTRPASPLGVRIVVFVLLLSGLALAALPLTVLLTGGGEPGRIGFQNASGEVLRSVRVIRIVGEQERLVGSAHDLADGASTDITFDAGDTLRLRVEFDADGGHHAVPLVLTEASADDASTRVRIGPGLSVQVAHERGAVPIETTESSAAPAEPSVVEPPTETTVASSAPHPVPDGWSEKWEPWFQHVDWVIGAQAGMEAARASGKPMMMFYTATW